MHERLGAVDEDVVVVRVRLAEVVGPGAEESLVLVPLEPATGPHEVLPGVVALRQLGGELRREALVRVLAVGPEVVPHAHDVLGLLRRQQRIQHQHVRKTTEMPAVQHRPPTATPDDVAAVLADVVYAF